MPYGTIKVDNIVFTNSGVDQTIGVSGLVQSVSGNLTATGTISGNLIRGTTVSGATITGQVLTVTSGIFSSGTASAPSIGFTGDGNTGFWTPAGDAVALSTGGSERLRVDSDGDLGVGTTDPTSRLTVRADAASGPNTIIRVENRAASAGATTQNIKIEGIFDYNNGTSDASAGAIVFGKEGTYTTATTNNDSYLALETVLNNTSTERLRITSDGNVGIGTSDPTTILQSSLSGSSAGLVVDKSAPTIVLNDSNGTTGASYWGQIDTATYFYNKASGFLALGTNNAERLRITSDGKVGIGTSSPGANLDVTGTSGTYPTQQIKHSALDTEGEFLRVTRTDNSGARYHSVVARHSTLTTSGNNYIQFKIHDPAINSTAQNTVLHLDGTGRVGIGATSPGSTLEINAAASTAPFIAKINTSEVARIDSSGRLLVGTSAARTDLYAAYTSPFQVETSVNDLSRTAIFSHNNSTSAGPLLNLVKSRGTSSGAVNLVQNGDELGAVLFAGTDGAIPIQGASIVGYVDGTPGTNDMPGRLVFNTTADGSSGPGERMRINSSGQVLIGTSTAPPAMAVGSISLGTAGGRKLNIYYSNTTHMGLGVDVGGGPYEFSVFGPGGNSTQGTIRFGFITEANPGTWGEKARFTAQGYLKASNDGTYTDTGGNDRSNTLHHMFKNTQNSLTVLATNTNTSSAVEGFTSDFANGATGNHFIGAVNLIRTFIVAANGNVTNTNNSYGAISDIKLKENIVNANSQWDDIKALQVRNYNFKEGQTHTQIGLVAQEVELVSPGLVNESPDLDKDGTELGTVTKSVNYSVLYMKAIKALQEAMERIETLEAKVTALENV